MVSCTLVQLDPACLHNSSLVFNGTSLTLLDQPGNSTYTFSSEDGDEATFTVDSELGAVWGNAELADGRDFIIEPNLDNCIGCHVVIEENREAFHRNHKVSPALVEMRSDSNWVELAALLKKGRNDKTTMDGHLHHQGLLYTGSEEVCEEHQDDGGSGYCDDQPGVHQQQDPPQGHLALLGGDDKA